MKVEVAEYQAEFCISFEAESVAEAASLVRLGLLHTKKSLSIWATPTEDGRIMGEIQVSKTQIGTQYVDGNKS